MKGSILLVCILAGVSSASAQGSANPREARGQFTPNSQSEQTGDANGGGTSPFSPASTAQKSTGEETKIPLVDSEGNHENESQFVWLYKFFGLLSPTSGSEENEMDQPARKSNSNSNSNSNSKPNPQLQMQEQPESRAFQNNQDPKIIHRQKAIVNPRNSQQVCITVHSVATCAEGHVARKSQQHSVSAICRQHRGRNSQHDVEKLRRRIERGERIDWSGHGHHTKIRIAHDTDCAEFSSRDDYSGKALPMIASGSASVSSSLEENSKENPTINSALRLDSPISEQDQDRFYSSKPKTFFIELELTESQLLRDFGYGILKHGPLKTVPKTQPCTSSSCPIPVPPPLPPPDKNNAKFFLYTSEKPDLHQSIHVLGLQDFSNIQFLRGADTVIICHGFMSNAEQGPGSALKEAYLSSGRRLNIIVVDWSPLAAFYTSLFDIKLLRRIYYPPAMNVQTVGAQTRALIKKLEEKGGIQLSQIHLVGHSLGAQAMGYAAKILRHYNEQIVGRLTALDPAGPCYERDSFLRLYCYDDMTTFQPVSKNDADFVDAVHTNSAVLGMTQPVGHVDFYPNGGRYQPGCWYFATMFNPACSHGRSIQLMAASILAEKEDFRAARCASQVKASKRDCAFNGSEVNYMGQYVRTDERSHGVFYLPTTSAAPFKATWRK